MKIPGYTMLANPSRNEHCAWYIEAMDPGRLTAVVSTVVGYLLL